MTTKQIKNKKWATGFLPMAMALAIGMATLFTACDKDESMPTPASLNGTTWSGVVIMKTVVEEYERLMTLTFSATTCTYTIVELDGSNPATIDCTYEYDKPLITTYLSGAEQTTVIASGAVDGNKMTLRNSGASGGNYVLTRK